MSVNFMKAIGSVGAGARLASTLTPPDGKKVTITAFMGKAEFSKNAYCAVIFNYGAVDPNDEEFIYLEKGSGGNHPDDVQTVMGDGTKKIAVVCANSEPTDAIVMEAYATIDVEE